NASSVGRGAAASEGAAFAEAFARERARTLQVPPVYSAIRTDGERSFARARRGETPELAARAVIVRRLELVAGRVDPPALDIAIETGKGYYVRSLARDLAEGLGTVGHLTALRRTRSGCSTLAEAVALDAQPEELRASVEPLASAAARALPVARLSELGGRDAGHGRTVSAPEMTSPTRAHRSRTPLAPGSIPRACSWRSVSSKTTVAAASCADSMENRRSAGSLRRAMKPTTLAPHAKDEHYDWIIIGSGFGGSVSALRLAEKGYRVLVLERLGEPRGQPVAHDHGHGRARDELRARERLIPVSERRRRGATRARSCLASRATRS